MGRTCVCCDNFRPGEPYPSRLIHLQKEEDGEWRCVDVKACLDARREIHRLLGLTEEAKA